MKRRITVQLIEEYKKHLYMEEKSKATIEKYASDLTKLMNYAGSRNIDKELMIKYKEYLIYVGEIDIDEGEDPGTSVSEWSYVADYIDDHMV